MMMSSMIVTLFFVSRLRMIARFFAVVNCLYGGGGDFAGKIELPAPHNKPLIIRRLPQSRRVRQLLTQKREAPFLYAPLFIIRRLPQSRCTRQLPHGRSQGG